MQHHVTGVKVHQLDTTFIMTWTDVFHPDSNVTINSLVYVLNEVCKANSGKMPPTLYLQADNSAKDNKNSFLMTFLAWLVKQKVFKKIKIGFLMVGHTHEDIDQVFSRISVHMRKTDAPTLPTLLQSIRNSTEKPPVALHLSSIYDYKKELEHCRGLIVGISGPHQFVIKEVGGKVVLKYKDWPKSEEQYRQVELTDAASNTTFDNLETVEPNKKVDESISRMRVDINKWAENGRMNQAQIDWWNGYLQSIKEDCIKGQDIPKATELGQFNQPTETNNETESTNIKKAINSAQDKENRISDLKVRGKKRKRRD